MTKQKIKKQLYRNLEQIVETIKKEYKPEKIILFGSLARGDIHEGSDIDLLIIKHSFKSRLERIDEVTKMCDYNVGFEPVVLTPQELESRCLEGDFFLQDILKQGKILYAK